MASIDAERWLAEHDQIDPPRTVTEYHMAPAVHSAKCDIMQNTSKQS
jgi:hypothetical protein